MGAVVDNSEKYSNDSDALDRWIADCFMDPQPRARYYHHDQPAENNDDVIIAPKENKSKSKALVCEKRVVKLDPVSALEETRRFVADLLRDDNTNKTNVFHQEKRREGLEKQVVVTSDYDSRLKASKRKFNDNDVEKQKTVFRIVRRKPEQRKPSLREGLVATGTQKKYKFQALVC